MLMHPIRKPQLAWREIDGEILIISPEDSQVHELNETAAFVWNRADGVRSVEEIAAELTAEFDVDISSARADIAELIVQLADKGLLLTAAAARG